MNVQENMQYIVIIMYIFNIYNVKYGTSNENVQENIQYNPIIMYIFEHN